MDHQQDSKRGQGLRGADLRVICGVVVKKKKMMMKMEMMRMKMKNQRVGFDPVSVSVSVFEMIDC